MHPQQRTSGAFQLSSQGKVSERLTRDGDAIFYTVTVDDPVTFDQVWKAEYTFAPIKGHVYEYACHEGNYAMPHMLAGQRMQDEAAAKARSKAKPAKED